MHRNIKNRRVSRAVSSAIEVLEDRRFFAATMPELLAIEDSTKNFGNTREAIAFYDISSTPGATTPQFGQLPLFSIWTTYEVTDVPGTTSGDRDFEEEGPMAISTDGGTAYMLATDSGTAPSQNPNSNDTGGDYDLYIMDIRAAFNYITAHPDEKGAMFAPTKSIDYIPGANISGIDYLATYTTLNSYGLPAVTASNVGIPPGRDNTNASKADDIIFLPGVSQKAGEIARRGGGNGPFFDDQELQYVNDHTLLLDENTTATSNNATGPITQDYSIRSIERVSTSTGAATAKADETGGYNGNTTQSWESVDFTGDNYFNMDGPVDPVAQPGVYNISDIDGMRYVNKNGVQGVWVTDRDGGGDDFSFFKLDLVNHVATKVQFKDVGAANYTYEFELDEDPQANDTTNDGNVYGFDVDANGGLVIRKSDYFGLIAPASNANQQPQIITLSVTNYNAGVNPANNVPTITLGAYQTLARLVPTPTDEAVTTPPTPINGEYAVYDQAQNAVYFVPKDALNADVYVYGLASQSQVYSELDAVDHGFFSGNRIRAFTLVPTDTTPPTVVSSSFSYAGTGQSIAVTFSEDVSASLAAGDFVLKNVTTNTVIPTSSLTVTYAAATNIATITFTGTTGVKSTVLPSGRYTLAFTSAGISDPAGNALTTTTPFAFGFKDADFNGTFATDFDDLLILAKNYGKTSGATFAQGDANYSGTVDFDDLLILAKNYGQSLPPAASPTAAAAKKPTRAGVASDVLA